MSPLLLLALLVFTRCGDNEIIDMQPHLEDVFQADPTIFFHEGTYYLYGTKDQAPNQGFEVYQSKDLKEWEGPVGVNGGFALSKNDVFGDVGFWAPQVWYENGKFIMAYTANENIAVATSDSPLGPFTQAQKTPIASGKQIDPFVFRDSDGKKYLYHVRLESGNRIYVAELNDDYSGIKERTLTECISAVLPWEKTQAASVAEGPTIIKLEGLYYMFYSANDFRNPNYAVGAAVANNVYGPWQKIGNQALLSIHNTNWAGTGHGDVFKKGNDWYYVCHTHFSSQTVTPRRTAIIPFSMEKKGGNYLTPVFQGNNFEQIKAKKSQ